MQIHFASGTTMVLFGLPPVASATDDNIVVLLAWGRDPLETEEANGKAAWDLPAKGMSYLLTPVGWVLSKPNDE